MRENGIKSKLTTFIRPKSFLNLCLAGIFPNMLSEHAVGKKHDLLLCNLARPISKGRQGIRV
jgi:hypothetical protein